MGVAVGVSIDRPVFAAPARAREDPLEANPLLTPEQQHGKAEENQTQDPKEEIPATEHNSHMDSMGGATWGIDSSRPGVAEFSPLLSSIGSAEHSSHPGNVIPRAHACTLMWCPGIDTFDRFDSPVPHFYLRHQSMVEKVHSIHLSDRKEV